MHDVVRGDYFSLFDFPHRCPITTAPINRRARAQATIAGLVKQSQELRESDRFKRLGTWHGICADHPVRFVWGLTSALVLTARMTNAPNTMTHPDDGVSALHMGVFRKGGVVIAANDAHQAVYLGVNDYYNRGVQRRTIYILLGAS